MKLSCKNNTVLTTEQFQPEMDAFLYAQETISDDAAMTIAAWYMSPGAIGKAFSALVHSEVDHMDLLSDIQYTEMHPDDYDALRDWVSEKIIRHQIEKARKAREHR